MREDSYAIERIEEYVAVIQHYIRNTPSNRNEREENLGSIDNHRILFKILIDQHHLHDFNQDFQPDLDLINLQLCPRFGQAEYAFLPQALRRMYSVCEVAGALCWHFSPLRSTSRPLLRTWSAVHWATSSHRLNESLVDSAYILCTVLCLSAHGKNVHCIQNNLLCRPKQLQHELIIPSHCVCGADLTHLFNHVRLFPCMRSAKQLDSADQKKALRLSATCPELWEKEICLSAEP